MNCYSYGSVSRIHCWYNAFGVFFTRKPFSPVSFVLVKRQHYQFSTNRVFPTKHNKHPERTNGNCQSHSILLVYLNAIISLLMSAEHVKKKISDCQKERRKYYYAIFFCFFRLFRFPFGVFWTHAFLWCAVSRTCKQLLVRMIFIRLGVFVCPHIVWGGKRKSFLRIKQTHF